ncbi:vegetative incompatibility protein HET-E-1, partial [Podospora aff. communis PSN243]
TVLQACRTLLSNRARNPGPHGAEVTRNKLLIQQVTQDRGGSNVGEPSPSTATGIFGRQDLDRAFISLRCQDDDVETDIEDTDCVKAILKSLEAPLSTARQKAIPKAYQDTFEWIFEQSPSQTSADWLQSDSPDVYWITGKPGSGKSTIMKYIVGDPRTVSHLQQWSSPRTLVMAAFYSWSAGTELQKTQEGLLQSLLCQILEQVPEIAPQLFPSRWATLKLFGKDAIRSFPEWTWQELFDGMGSLGSFTHSMFQLAVFIDGLDEFTGHVSGLIQLIKDLPGAKVCISSRPWNEFRDAFAGCPSLRMELLTKGDMERFTRGRFGSNRAFVELRANFPEEADGLLLGIVEKALGVFLWVSIVTRTILAGLTDGDSLQDLQSMLEELPGDLVDLYSSLWRRINTKYRPHGVRIITIFRTFIRSPRTGLGKTLPERLLTSGIPAYILWFADGGAPADTDYITKTLTRRLASRTRGLLEMTPSGQVDCLHRTRRPQISTSTWGSSKASSRVDLEKNGKHSTQDAYSDALLLFCFHFASRIDNDNSHSCARLVKALDRLCACLVPGSTAAAATTTSTTPSPSTVTPPGFILVAAEFGITPYVAAKVNLETNKHQPFHISPILSNLISGLILGPTNKKTFHWDTFASRVRRFSNTSSMFGFNAAGRYQLADKLLGEVCKMCVDPSEVNVLLAELHKEVTEGIGAGSGKKKKDMEELVIVEGEEVQYGSAVLDMVERREDVWAGWLVVMA